MPDILLVLSRRWQLVLMLTLAGTLAAYIASLLSPKLYMSSTTALPVNTLVNDRARIFNKNIEALYSEIGTPDELDKIEGTSKLDTVYLAIADAHRLAIYYGVDTAAGDNLQKAALLLRKASDISRTGFGELKIKVWDKNADTAATLANGLMQTINAIHERLQTENNRNVLQQLKDAYAKKIQDTRAIEKDVVKTNSSSLPVMDTSYANPFVEAKLDNEEAKQYLTLIHEYEISLNTSPKVLLIEEKAQRSPWYDRPKTVQNVSIAFFVSLLFAFLLAVFIESRNSAA